jgi:putative FmdB family regulatory protein
VPLYDFECAECNVTFEVSRSFADSDVPAHCPRCEKQARRLLSAPLTVFTRGGAAESLRAPGTAARWSHHGHSHGPGSGSGGHTH